MLTSTRTKSVTACNRRTFLSLSSAAVLGWSLRASASRGPSQGLSPNEKLIMAHIGACGKGAQDIQGCRSQNITAICDVDERRATPAWRAFPKARRYVDFRKMLEKEKGVDAVVISIPDHMHYAAAMTAISLGKHVFVQKPLCATIQETRALTEAARRAGVATQMGIQYHCSDSIRVLCEMIWSGAIGKIHEVHIWTNRPEWPQGIRHWLPAVVCRRSLHWNLWLGVARRRPYNPGYAPGKWRGWWDFGTCALGDMGCHLMEPAYWALKLGPPSSVEVVTQRGRNKHTGPLSSILKFEFPQRGHLVPVTLYWYDGGELPARPEGISLSVRLGEKKDGKNGTLFIGEKGIITCGKYGAKDPRLIPDELMADYQLPTPSLRRIPGGRDGHYEDWFRACRGERPAGATFDYSGPFTEAVLLGNVALRCGGRMEWDAQNMRVTNCPEANQYLTRHYRKGWRI